MSAPWNPSTPLIKGNMSTLISNIVRTMEIMDIKLFKAIVIVLKRQIGASKYAELLTQNVSNGSNDQKRLVLMVVQAYRNSKKRPKRVENNFYWKINLLKNYEPMPSNPGLNHPVIFSKVQKAFNEALEKLVIDIHAHMDEADRKIFLRKLTGDQFEKLKHRLKKVGLELRSEYELGREYTVRINRRSRQNISGRYGPDKDRFIQIPNYQRRRIFGDYDQRKVLAAVANIPEFNWVIEGLTGNYTTTLTKIPDDEFIVIKRKLRTVKLRMVEYRSTYFDIAYRIIPNENSEEVHGYSRSSYV
jgi:hypothetical protein